MIRRKPSRVDAFGKDSKPVVIEEGRNQTAKPSVFGGVHGNEPCGIKGIDIYFEDNSLGDVRFITANPRAPRKEVRYIDTDLNRAFNGGEDFISELYEERLAAQTRSGLEDLDEVIDPHFSLSFERNSDRFVLLTELNDQTVNLARSTGMEKLKDFSFEPGGMPSYQDISGIGIEVRGDPRAADFAYDVICNLLTGDVYSDPELYKAFEAVPISTEGADEVLVDDFDQVRPGDIYCIRGGEEITAEQSFTPVLGQANPNEIGTMMVKTRYSANVSDYRGDSR